MIQIGQTLLTFYPSVISRHWPICVSPVYPGGADRWQHFVFNCAVYMATLILASPQNEFARLALGVVDSAITFYTSMVQLRSAERFARNLHCILRLRARAFARMQSSAFNLGNQTVIPQPSESENELEMAHRLLGRKTRLIEPFEVSFRIPATSSRTPAPPSQSDFDSVLASLSDNGAYEPGSSIQAAQPAYLDSIYGASSINARTGLEDSAASAETLVSGFTIVR